MSLNHPYPFPQFHLQGEKYFLLTSSFIDAMDCEYNSEWNRHDVVSGYSWHVADFGAFWVFANGVDVAAYSIANDYWQPWLETFPGSPLFGTCCNFNGQLFIGNIIPREIEGEVTTIEGAWGDATGDYVGWSKIGRVDFTLDKSNVAGYSPMGFGGQVQRVLQLGKTVIAYGNKGVQVYFPTIEHAVGFGKKNLPLPGCAGRSAVNGDENQHLMIDVTGQAWLLKVEQAPELLGFQQYFRPMLGRDIVVTYNSAWKAFDITDGETAYRLTPAGLCRTWQGVTSQFVTPGGVIGSYEALDDRGMLVVSEQVDFGFRGHKTITSVQVGGSFSQPVFVSIDWRSHNEKYFRSTPWVKLSPDGVARPRVTADEFRIKLQSKSFEDVELDYVAVTYQITDRRNLRGSTDVSKTSSRTDSE